MILIVWTYASWHAILRGLRRHFQPMNLIDRMTLRRDRLADLKAYRIACENAWSQYEAGQIGPDEYTAQTFRAEEGMLRIVLALGWTHQADLIAHKLTWRWKSLTDIAEASYLAREPVDGAAARYVWMEARHADAPRTW